MKMRPDSITNSTLAAQADLLADCAATQLPDGSLVIGEDRVFAELNKGAPEANATSLISGVIRALKAVDAKRIVVATPYIEDINRLEAEYLEASDFKVLSIAGLGIERDSDMVRVEPDFIREFAVSVDRPDADAIFISCGALRTLDVVQNIESAVAIPVIASNQAMVWDTLRLAGVEDRIDGYGRLLRDL